MATSIREVVSTIHRRQPMELVLRVDLSGNTLFQGLVAAYGVNEAGHSSAFTRPPGGGVGVGVGVGVGEGAGPPFAPSHPGLQQKVQKVVAA